MVVYTGVIQHVLYVSVYAVLYVKDKEYRGKKLLLCPTWWPEPQLTCQWMLIHLPY